MSSSTDTLAQAGTLPAAASALTDAPVVCVSHGFQANYERGFCNGLAARGVAVTLVSSDRTDEAGLLPNARAVNLRGSQDEDRSRWHKAGNMLRYHASLMLYALWRRRAVWHVMGLLAPLAWCGVVEGLWFRLICRRYVLTVHDVLPHGQHNVKARLLCGLAYRLPHSLVVHTARMRSRLVDEFGLRPERIVVMEHGIEPAKAVSSTALDLPDLDARPQLLAFGFVAPRKGIDLLIDATRELSFPFRLVVAGHCPDDGYRQQLQASLQGHPHRDDIEWHDGFVKEADMDDLFGKTALLVLPYRYIDQSGVLFQALRFGLPVLATRVGDFERYIDGDLGVLADEISAAGIAAALERWALQRTRFSRARIQQIGRAYEWPATVAALRPAYGLPVDPTAAMAVDKD